MKLYHSSASPNSRRVRILIAEKGLDIELTPVDLGAKEQFSDAYRAINPRAVRPAPSPLVTTTPSTREIQPKLLICTPGIAAQTFTAYQSETPKKQSRIVS